MQYGYNEVPEEKERPLRRFLKKFWGVSAWMLEPIIILSAVLHKYADLAVVAGLLVVAGRTGRSGWPSESSAQDSDAGGKSLGTGLQVTEPSY